MSTKPVMREFTDRWMTEFQQAHGRKYFFAAAKDGSAAARLLKQGFSVEELITVAKQAWANKVGFWSKHAISLASFASRFNEIRHENEASNNGLSGSRNGKQVDRNAGTANFGRAADYKHAGKLR